MPKTNTRLYSIQDTLYTNNAHDVSKDDSINISQITIIEKLKETANLPKTINVKIGTRVMLTCNIDVSDGLTNGAMGTITGIVQKQNNTLHIILVQFNTDKVGDNAKSNSKYKDRDSDAVPIEKWQGQFKVKKHHVRVLRKQFPLILCWAVTIHKCQELPPQPKPISSTIERSSHTIILHLNVAGLLVKQLDIKCDDYIKQADVVCFNETHISSQHTITFDNKYIIFRKRQK